jgi:hypothetical protein
MVGMKAMTPFCSEYGLSKPAQTRFRLGTLFGCELQLLLV